MVAIDQNAAESDPWYAVMTRPGMEQKADRALRERGFMTFYPFTRERKYRKRPGSQKRHIVEIERPYFSRYLFIVLRWGQSVYAVNEAPGVSTVVYFGGHPLHIPDDVMGEIIRMADPEPADENDRGMVGFTDLTEPAVSEKREPLAVGTKILHGDNSPFAGLVSQIAFDDGNKIRVWLRMLGVVKPALIDSSMIAEIVS